MVLRRGSWYHGACLHSGAAGVVFPKGVSMKSLFVLAALAFALSMTIAPTHAFAAKSSSKKSEPAPKDRDERKGGEERSEEHTSELQSH